MISTSHVPRRNNRKLSRLGLELLEDRRLLSADSWVAPSGDSGIAGLDVAFYFGKHMIDVDDSGAAYVAQSRGPDQTFDFLVRKLSPEGDAVWTNEVTSGGDYQHPADVALSSDGQFLYVTGFFRGSVNLDPQGSPTGVLQSAGGSDAFLAKYDTTDGTLQWANRWGGTGEDQAKGIAVAGSSLYLTGEFTDSIDFDGISLTSAGNRDVFVTKLTESGNVTWANRAGGRSLDYPSDIAVHSQPSGNDVVYIVGNFNGRKVRFGETNLRSKGSADVFVSRVSGDTGTFEWAERFGGGEHEQGNAIEVDNAGDVYVAGRFWGQADFGPFTMQSGGGNSDAFLTKVSDLGNQGSVAWVRQVSSLIGSEASDVALQDGRIYLTGIFEGTAAFDTTNSITSRGLHDGFLAAYDTYGNVEYTARLGGSNEDSALGVAAQGRFIYVGGQFDSAGADFPTGDVLTNSVPSEIFTMKLDTSAPGITASPAFGLETTETGGTTTFNVVLDMVPTADVTIGITSSDTTEGTVDKSSLTFTPANWNVPQTVTVQGIDDADQDGDQVYAIWLAPAASADPNYSGLDATDVSVTNLDNEVPPPTVNIVYAWEMTSEIRNRGKHTDVRFTIDVNQDSNFDGWASSSDSAAANVLVTVELYDSSGVLVGTYTGTTDSQGIFRTNWIRGLDSDTYTAEVVDLALAGFDWIQLRGIDGLFHDDADSDGFPDELFTI